MGLNIFNQRTSSIPTCTGIIIHSTSYKYRFVDNILLAVFRTSKTQSRSVHKIPINRPSDKNIIRYSPKIIIVHHILLVLRARRYIRPAPLLRRNPAFFRNYQLCPDEWYRVSLSKTITAQRCNYYYHR
jgi:hypothetical protein